MTIELFIFMMIGWNEGCAKLNCDDGALVDCGASALGMVHSGAMVGEMFGQESSRSALAQAFSVVGSKGCPKGCVFRVPKLYVAGRDRR